MHIYAIRAKSPPTLESLSEAFGWYGVDAGSAPLELAMLTALTPTGVDLTPCDQQAGDTVDFDVVCDAVLCVVNPAQIPGLRYLSGRFRARRIPLVVAGPFVTAHPELATFADSVLIGELEAVVPLLVKALSSGNPLPRRLVAESPVMDLATPEWKRLELDRYLTVPVEVARAGDGGGPTRRKPVGRVVDELQSLLTRPVRRVTLLADDLLEDSSYASDLLKALASFHEGRESCLRFDAKLTLASALTGELSLLRRANIRRVSLELLGVEGEASARAAQAREAVDRLRKAGIRVAGALTLGAEETTEEVWQSLCDLARGSLARPLLQTAKAIPGTPLYKRLEAAGRLIAAGRDAEFRQDLFDVPNFRLPVADPQELLERMKTLLLEVYDLKATVNRVVGAVDQVDATLEVDPWPAREDVVALLRMLSGALNTPEEHRLRLVVMAVIKTAMAHPHPSLWSQALVELLEEVATRSFVVKVSQGRPLDAALPPVDLKQRLIGLGAKVAAKVATFRAANQ